MFQPDRRSLKSVHQTPLQKWNSHLQFNCIASGVINVELLILSRTVLFIGFGSKCFQFIIMSCDVTVLITRVQTLANDNDRMLHDTSFLSIIFISYFKFHILFTGKFLYNSATYFSFTLLPNIYSTSFIKKNIC